MVKADMTTLTEKQKEAIRGLQESVDEMKQSPQFRQYVEQRKLSLINSKFEMIDRLLNLGVLK